VLRLQLLDDLYIYVENMHRIFIFVVVLHAIVELAYIMASIVLRLYRPVKEIVIWITVILQIVIVALTAPPNPDSPTIPDTANAYSMVFKTVYNNLHITQLLPQ
jgi:hypothetical protein